MGFKNKRTVLAIALLFVVIAVVYLAVSHDAGGATTLIGLGIAMGVASYALVVGTPDDV
jgi:LPS O-antigen subunit length determinant protein (WzzB/FepE family)